MDVVGVAHVHRHGHPRVGNLLAGQRLRLPLVGVTDMDTLRIEPILRGGVPVETPRSDLHVIERHLAAGEIAPPRVDERLHQQGIDRIVVPVALALVPRHAAYRQGQQRVDHAVVEFGGTHQHVHIGIGLVRIDESRIQPAVAFEGFDRRIGLRRGAAVGGVDQSDGHAQLLMEHPSEIVAHGALGSGRRGTRGIPLAIGCGHVALPVEDRVGCIRRLHGVKADVRIIRGADLSRGIEHLPHGESHVRLPAQQPHLADKQVAQDRFLKRRGDHDRLRSIVRRRRCDRNFQHPRAVRTGLAGIFPIGPARLCGDLHVGGGGLAPQAERLVLLDHHTVLQETMQPECPFNPVFGRVALLGGAACKERKHGNKHKIEFSHIA